MERAVGPLHPKDPFQFVSCLVQDIGQAVPGLRDIQGIGTSFGEEQMRVHQVRRRHGAGTDVFAVIPGVVPAAANAQADGAVFP